MPQESSTSSPIPMAPFSSSVLPDHPNSQPCITTGPMVSTAATASVSRTSLVITIVTTEQVPNSNINDGTTTTIERELKMRLKLPACYDTTQLKSLNVRLHQDPINNNIYPSLYPNPYEDYSTPGYVPSSSPTYFKDTAKAHQQQWQQEQSRLFQEEASHQVLPEPVSSFRNNEINTQKTTNDSSLCCPDDVSSSPSFTNSNNGTKRTRTRTPPKSPTMQSSQRKKRKITNNKANHLSQ